MASWNQNPAWIDISEINSGNQIEPGDGFLASDMVKVVENLQYLYKNTASIYKVQGSSNTVTLNGLSKTESMNGYVYDLTDSGTLNNQDGTTITVSAGDNVLFLWNDGTWKWDKLAATIDLSSYYTKTETDNLLGTKVNKTITIAGIALSSNISAQSLTEALNYDVDQDVVDYIMGVA